jgi:tRNA 2-thiocytidine biosynthesis protein TtcA
VDYTDHGIVAHSKQNRENPCFLCSRLRRKRLFEIADELGCTKLALGHNKDDIIETLFMNMFYSGGISTMNPSQFLFKGRFQIIRPLSFVDEHIIRRFAGKKAFPKFFNPCPSASTSKRYEIKMLLDRLYQNNENIKGNIFRAMGNIKKEYLLV